MLGTNLKCQVCGTSILPGKHGSPRKYCGPKCGWKARNSRRSEKKRPVIRLVKGREGTVGQNDPGLAPKVNDVINLRPRAQAWLSAVLKGWRIDESKLELVRATAVALSRSIEAREVLDEEGVILAGKTPRPHPAARIEREATALFSRLLQQLNLED